MGYRVSGEADGFGCLLNPIPHPLYPRPRLTLKKQKRVLSLFANPFTMIAGALLISSPIIIHLINRMRYKRVRWAAMEFLLKSQKRSRRKLIIEQMILLALRILMVLLVGLLLARFVGCNDASGQGRNTIHIILIDDTLSTSDIIRGEDGVSRSAYEEAKRLAVNQI